MQRRLLCAHFSTHYCNNVNERALSYSAVLRCLAAAPAVGAEVRAGSGRWNKTLHVGDGCASGNWFNRVIAAPNAAQVSYVIPLLSSLGKRWRYCLQWTAWWVTGGLGEIVPILAASTALRSVSDRWK